MQKLKGTIDNFPLVNESIENYNHRMLCNYKVAKQVLILLQSFNVFLGDVPYMFMFKEQNSFETSKILGRDNEAESNVRKQGKGNNMSFLDLELRDFRENKIKWADYGRFKY